MKKGDISVNQIILIAIFILALFAVGFAAFRNSDLISRINQTIPNLRPDKTPISDYQIIGYSLIENKVQYNDGVKWLDFEEQKITLGDKKLDWLALSLLVGNNNYFSLQTSRDPIKFQIDESIPQQLYQFSEYEKISVEIPSPLPLSACAISLEKETTEDIAEKWDVVIKLVSKNSETCSGKNYGEFTVNREGEVFFRPFSQDSQTLEETRTRVLQTDIQEQIRELAWQWLDSTSQNPTTLWYLEENNARKEILVCWTRSSGRLVFDLSKPKSAGETC